MTPLDRAAKALYDSGRPPRPTAEHWNLEWDDPMFGETTREMYRIRVREVLLVIRKVGEAQFQSYPQTEGRPLAFVAVIDGILKDNAP